MFIIGGVVLLVVLYMMFSNSNQSNQSTPVKAEAEAETVTDADKMAKLDSLIKRTFEKEKRMVNDNLLKDMNLSGDSDLAKKINDLEFINNGGLDAAIKNMENTMKLDSLNAMGMLLGVTRDIDFNKTFVRNDSIKTLLLPAVQKLSDTKDGLDTLDIFLGKLNGIPLFSKIGEVSGRHITGYNDLIQQYDCLQVDMVGLIPLMTNDFIFNQNKKTPKKQKNKKDKNGNKVIDDESIDGLIQIRKERILQGTAFGKCSTKYVVEFTRQLINLMLFNNALIDTLEKYPGEKKIDRLNSFLKFKGILKSNEHLDSTKDKCIPSTLDDKMVLRELYKAVPYNPLQN